MRRVLAAALFLLLAGAAVLLKSAVVNNWRLSDALGNPLHVAMYGAGGVVLVAALVAGLRRR
jgi:hypothetical protein